MTNYKIIDPLIGILCGAFIAFAVHLTVPSHWNMFAAMMVGGMLGMLVKFPLMFLLVPLFGAFEVMIPLSIIAMLAGMASGMAATVDATPHLSAVSMGAIIGLAVVIAVQITNRKFAREN